MLKQAILSTANKTGLAEFARQLTAYGINIIATGGTAELLQQSKLNITEVSEYTGFPEIMSGRVKTLHPKIHAGLLARRGIDDEIIKQQQIKLIDLVVVNLYPFQQTIAQTNCSLDQAIEQIDIGGPTLIRAAAKNHQWVTVVIDPADYPRVLAQIQQYGNTTLETRRQLAAKAFTHIANYDAAIAHYFKQLIAPEHPVLPEQITSQYHKQQDLRYGENPHQIAAIYTNSHTNAVSTPQLLQGKALSFNNIIDSETAMHCVLGLDSTQAGCVIVKHATPCGAAQAASLVEAYNLAYTTDSSSAFGGIIAFNQPVDGEVINAIFYQQFVEVLIAPSFTTEALALCQNKPNLRVLTCNQAVSNQPPFSLHAVSTGLLIQQSDTHRITAQDLQIVTQKSPNSQQVIDLLFAWHIAKFVKSNAIVYAKDQATLGIGSGQTSRVFSAQIALLKAKQANLSLDQAVMASDAFLPFADSVQIAAEAGICAIIQTGGSKRDPEVIAAANEAGITMVFTGIRHFRH